MVCQYGSSPLARGLHTSPKSCVAKMGIIPARAGFTGPHGEEVTEEKDHPRSRGVYEPRHSIFPFDARIIPARAGFTLQARLKGLHQRDHPRSRGVYCRIWSCVYLSGGSSPLARGLLGRIGRPRCGLRIIPARAGFTAMSGPMRARRHMDHPRSRGVYAADPAATALNDGSSPLARGLQGLYDELHAGRRIIPARAGFTGPALRERRPGPDHPRSRGVYPLLH